MWPGKRDGAIGVLEQVIFFSEKLRNKQTKGQTPCIGLRFCL